MAKNGESQPKPAMKAARTQSDLEEMIREGGEVRRVDAPSHFATTIRAAWTSNNCTITFSRGHPVEVGSIGEPVYAELAEPVAVISMSPGTAKDLFTLLRDSIDKFEAEWGAIETEFTRKRKQQ